MTRRILTACAVLTAATATAADKPVILEAVAVADRAKLKGQTAYTFRKPQGWKHDGTVAWQPAYVHQANVKLRVWDPDSLEQVSTSDWAWCAHVPRPGFPVKRFDPFYGGVCCEPMSPVKLQAELVKHQGAKALGRVVGQTDLPDLAAAYAKATGLKAVQAGKTRIAYKVESADVEEDFYLILGYFDLPVPGGTMTLFCPLAQPVSLRAAKGKLDAATPRLAAVALTLQPTKEFVVALGEGLAELNKDFASRLAEIDKLSKAVSAHNDAMLAMIRQERESRWAAEDKRSRDFSDYIRGVERFTDGRTEYTVPSTHKYAWADGSGTVYLSNEAGDDPNRTQRGTWTQLKLSK